MPLRLKAKFPTTTDSAGITPAYAKSQGEYGLASFLFPKVVPIGKLNGKFEILGKYAKADFTHGIRIPNYDQKTTEVNFNYVIKQFNARVQTFYEDIRLQPVKARHLAGGDWPADSDVTHRLSN